MGFQSEITYFFGNVGLYNTSQNDNFMSATFSKGQLEWGEAMLSSGPLYPSPHEEGGCWVEIHLGTPLSPVANAE